MDDKNQFQNLEEENLTLKKQVQELQLSLEAHRKSQNIADVLYRISDAVNTTFNLDELYQEIHTALGEVIDTTNFYIALYHAKEDSMTFPYFVDESGDKSIKLTNVSQSQSLTVKVILSNKPILKTKAEMVAQNCEGEHLYLGKLSEVWLGVPLRIKNKVIGAIALQSYTNQDLYQPSDIKLVSAISDYIALAIHRRSVENSLIESRRQVRMLSLQMEQYSLTAASMLSLKEEKDIYKKITQTIVANSDFNRVLISFFMEQSSCRTILGHYGFSEEQLEKLRKNTVTKEVFENIIENGEKLGQKSYFISHQKYDINEYFNSLDDQITFVEGKSRWHPFDVLIVEINDENGEMIGIISVDNSKTGKMPTHETVRPLEVFSNLFAQIIIYKKSQCALKKTKSDLELANRDLVKVNKELGKAIDHANNMAIRAKTADRYKSEFLANMSHELRTPMQGVLGFASLGRNKCEVADRNRLKSYFQDIYESGQRLLILLNDLLDLSKLEAGMVSYQFKAQLLSDIVGMVLQEQQPILMAKNINLKFQEPDFSTKVKIDQLKMMQVVRNLLINAAKFSPSDSTIEIILSESPNGIMFRIIDEGIGVPEAELEDIFDKFIQSSKSKTNAGGTGLGLSICKQIINDHGGRIWAENGVISGAVLSFIIPRDIPLKAKQKLL